MNPLIAVKEGLELSLKRAEQDLSSAKTGDPEFHFQEGMVEAFKHSLNIIHLAITLSGATK